jgi:hypothetical protein
MRLSKIKILIIGFILWSLIIAIPQFNLNYPTGLLSGKLKYGEIPSQFYAGLIAGLFAALLIWGISILLAKLITKVRKKESKGSITFLYITLFFFAFMFLTQGKKLYTALNYDEAKVNETRKLIRQYQMHEENNRK